MQRRVRRRVCRRTTEAEVEPVVDDAMTERIMTDMQSSLDEGGAARREEEARLRSSTDASEHLCGPLCPHLKPLSRQRETTDYVCPISHQTWGLDYKWDAVTAGLLPQKDDNGVARHAQPHRRWTALQDRDVLPVQEADFLPMTPLDRETRESTPRAPSKSTRELDLVETQLSLCSVATQSIFQALRSMQLQHQTCDQIRAELISSFHHEHNQRRRVFTLTASNDICLEANNRWKHLDQRVRLYEHVMHHSTLLGEFVHTLAQLFATLWILATHNQIRRRELDSFRLFVQSLLNCLHRGMRILNQPILPQEILFFHDLKRKHRGESAHHALQQVQSAIAAIPTGAQQAHFQQCIRLSKQIEKMHDVLLKSAPQSTLEGLTTSRPSRGKVVLGRRSCGSSGSPPTL